MEVNEQMRELEAQVILGLQKAFKKLVQFKKKNNSPLVVSRDGKVTIIPADKINLTCSKKQH